MRSGIPRDNVNNEIHIFCLLQTTYCCVFFWSLIFIRKPEKLEKKILISLMFDMNRHAFLPSNIILATRVKKIQQVL